MNYIEEHGKKVAAVLCVASCFPVVAAVYAMETEPGWHGDRYINTDATVAVGWQEIEGKSYYFDESGEVDKEMTQQATVATVSQDVSQAVQQNVSTVTKEVVTEEVKAVDAQKEAEEKAAQEALSQQQAAQESVTIVEDTTADVSQPSYTEDTTVQTPSQDVTTPVVDETPTTPEVETPSQPVTPPAQDTTTTPPAVEETPSTPEVETPSQPVTPPAQEETTTPGTGNDTSAYADLNARIAAAAQTLVGVTDGQQCTQVVQQALALAGVSDAMQLWPDQYIMYGYYTDTPQAGNLVYYNNGGRGVDHIAIYIGNGLCVHGNFWTSDGTSKTIISSVYNGGGGTPQFIQVTR